MGEFFGDDEKVTENDVLDNADVRSHKETLIRAFDMFPDFVEYAWTLYLNCLGMISVYLIEISVKGQHFVKFGYTKNDIDTRFAEDRYEGSDDMDFVKEIKRVEIQGKGAVLFEKAIKDSMKIRGIKSANTGVTLPGKTEIFDMKHLGTLIEIWDKNISIYRNVRGLKPPN